MNPLLLKSDRLMAEIGRGLFRLPEGGPVKIESRRCWRDAPSNIKFVPSFYLTACDKSAGQNPLDMCDMHYLAWLKEPE